MAIYHHTTRMIGRGGGGSPVKALAYIAAICLSDQRTGERFNFSNKSVEEVQILLPQNAPLWAKEIQKLVSEDREKGLQALSDIVNSAEKRIDAQVYREVEFSLPRELTYEQNKALAEEYVQDQFCGLGMLAIQSFHVEKNKKTGELNPHCHTFLLTRELRDEGLSPHKNREWNERELHEVWREQWAQCASLHLKHHGYDITLDHRSYKEQGLDLEPQIKLGRGAKEQEERAHQREETRDLGSLKDRRSEEVSLEGIQGIDSRKESFVEASPVTDRGQTIRAIQLRNLYRIMRRPEVVFDIVTRHHATFMWGDVQKILNRYVDNLELFQRLDARLRGSKDLLLLKPEGGKDKDGQSEAQAIYTTRSMLRAEKELVGTAEALALHGTHGVSSASLERGLEVAQHALGEEGYSLSEGQEAAIRHLVDPGQLKCLVGYAGAGKTTALSACLKIWEDAGYRVYGLAPTGRAAQALEGSGLQSQTLHRFLKDFEGGRSQYSDKSVFVLDEAGMVDVGRFKGFLEAVKTLGVKCVVVGDSGQLQPVEAGPAFRLVTDRVGVTRLEEVVRQQVDWQREATVLFGKQEADQAICAYQERGHIHLVEERLPEGNTQEEVLTRYEIAARTSGLIFRSIKQDIKAYSPETQDPDHSVGQGVQDARQHQDYGLFLEWRSTQTEAACKILGNAADYRGLLETRGLNPLEMARLFVSKKQDKGAQYREAAEILKAKGLDHLIGSERVQAVEVRKDAKAALIADWQKAYQEDPQKSLLMMSYSNRDVRDLNQHARVWLKESGVLGSTDHTYKILREVEDDFGRRTHLKETRSLAAGDRILFTQNNSGLGVKNGSLGTIVELDQNKIEVRLAQGENLSFSPHLFPFFDQGWAITIHKSQATTVDRGWVLASFEMNQNLSYVAMTRHREDVQVYGSTLDFWRPEKVIDVLSKSGEKLGAADYLDAASLTQLMREEDRFLSQLFTRVSDELQAMGVVSKRAFTAVADHFLGKSSSKGREFDERSLMPRETIREEDRAQDILKNTSRREVQGKEIQDPQGVEYQGFETHRVEPREVKKDALSQLKDNLMQQKERINHTVQDIQEDFKHPAFTLADHYKKVFTEGVKLYGESKAVEYWQSKREEFFKLYEQKLERVEATLASPHLSYMSPESRDLAYKAAFEDPDKALKFLGHVKEAKQAEQEDKERAIQDHAARLSKVPSKVRNIERYGERESALERHPHDQREKLDKAHTAYFRFKDLSEDLHRSPENKDLHKELKKTGMIVFKDKEAFAHIEKIDPKVAHEIQKIAQLQEKERAMAIEREHRRGGYSL